VAVVDVYSPAGVPGDSCLVDVPGRACAGR